MNRKKSLRPVYKYVRRMITLQLQRYSVFELFTVRVLEYKERTAKEKELRWTKEYEKYIIKKIYKNSLLL